MPSANLTVDSSRPVNAADLYRAAFERLKTNKPERLPKGTPVSQNNVAKEAGSDPSALKKSRFPTLIAEIQKFVEGVAHERVPSVHQTKLIARKQNRGLKERIGEITQQRDRLASLLIEADATILELYDRIAELEEQLPPTNILPMDSRGRKRL